MSREVLISYITIEVSNLEKSISFFRDKIGLSLAYTSEEFGYASFESGSFSLGLVQNEQAEGNRHTGLGFAVDSLDDAYDDMSAGGVEFTQPPTQEDWGGYMAIFKDPDGNTYYLDQIDPPSEEEDSDKMNFDVSIDLTAGTVKDD